MELSWFNEIYKKHGFKFLFGFAFVIALSLFLCIRGWFDVSKILPSYLGIKCGCDTVNNPTVRILIENVERISTQKDSINDRLNAVNEQIKRISEELKQANVANDSLIGQRDQLEMEKAELLRQLGLKDSLYIVTKGQLDSVQNRYTQLKNDTSEKVMYESTIKEQANRISILNARNNILEYVYITKIEAKRIDDTKVQVSYTLRGTDSLQDNGYKDPPMIYLKIYDEDTGDYIERIEKNPATLRSENDSVTSQIEYGGAKENEYSGYCYFSNSQDKPFTRHIFNIKPKKFNFQFYLPGYNRPLSYYPSRLTRK